ncbi:MAG: hypothetical protein NTW59_05135 [Candidatus Diapherotrites archaeon]|nr:hypothetical protein [Candidatus Diapherotrites archaeon]
MLKTEFVYRELLFQCLERHNRGFTQRELSAQTGVSLTNVNHALLPLRRMAAVKVNPRNFSVVNPKKVLLYWASNRNLQRDIVYSTRADASVGNIEKGMPADTVFAAYSAYKFRFREAPADYSEVYVYAEDLAEIKRRFPAAGGPPNLFVLQKDGLMERYGKTGTIAQVFVDLWNMPEWYAKDFLKALEARIDAILE